MAPPARRPRNNGHLRLLHDELLFDDILTRLPAAAVVRFRAVCLSWRAEFTSRRFIDGHRAARAAARRQAPEIVFFAPAAAAAGPGYGTAFYTCTLPDGGPPADGALAVRELATAHNLRGDRLLMLTKPCHGLTLLLDSSPSTSTQYYVCNLSTGEHVPLPACAFATDVWNSSAGLCFDPAAGVHKVVRLFETSWTGHQSCEVHTLGSGLGWRPSAGQVPATRGLACHLQGQPPVLVNGSLYWPAHMARVAPAPILSFSVESEQFGWVHMPASQQLGGFASHLAELDGSLCAVVDTRLSVGEYALWTWNPCPTGTPSWSLRCRIILASLPRPMREELGCWMRVLPLCSTAGGDRILLATSLHEVLAYHPGSNTMEKVLSLLDFVDGVSHESELLLNIGLHEESVVGVGVGAGGGGPPLKMKLSSEDTVVARREGPGRRREELFGLNSTMQEVLQHFLGDAVQTYQQFMFGG